MSTTFKQDMPPKGGYAPIDFRRTLPKRGLSGFAMIGGAAAIIGISNALMIRGNHKRRDLMHEDRESYLGMMPLLEAERDREQLKQMKFVREQEAIIMKDVPDFVPGETVYHNDRWNKIRVEDLYYLSDSKNWDKAVHGFTFSTDT